MFVGTFSLDAAQMLTRNLSNGYVVTTGGFKRQLNAQFNIIQPSMKKRSITVYSTGQGKRLWLVTVYGTGQGGCVYEVSLV